MAEGYIPGGEAYLKGKVYYHHIPEDQTGEVGAEVSEQREKFVAPTERIMSVYDGDVNAVAEGSGRIGVVLGFYYLEEA